MISLKDTKQLVKEIVKIISQEGQIETKSVGKYSTMKYPKIISIVKLKVNEFFIRDYGNFFVMQTKSMGGMNLVTLAFTPNLGTDMPFLLIDCISMREKRAVFIEYYDCTTKKESPKILEDIFKFYKGLPDYKEKEDWYVPLRTPYSLIKGNTVKEESELVMSEVRAYMILSHERRNINEGNLEELKRFRERMIVDKNPSINILNKILGEKETNLFFRTCVMPID